MEWIFFWLGFAILVGILAGKRGRMGFGWFVLAVVFSPLLMGLLVLVLPDLKAKAAAAAAAAEAPNAQTHVRCPDCRELVRIDARKCKHCGSALVPQTPAPERPPGYEAGQRVAQLVTDHRGRRPDKDSPRFTGSDRLPPA